MKYFTNREISIIIWLLVITISLLFSKMMRSQLYGLFKSLSKLLHYFLIVILYESLVIYSLFLIGFWKIDLLKDTIIWIFSVGIVSLSKAVVSKSRNSNVFKKLVIENLKLTVVVEFLINSYVFPLPFEIFFIPIISIIVLITIFTESKNDFQPVYKLMNLILSFFGFVVITFVLIKAFNDSKTVFSLQTLQTIVLPLFLSISMIPIIYSFIIYSAYQNLFILLNHFIDRNNLKYFKTRIVKLCRFRLNRICIIENNYRVELINASSRNDIDNLIIKYRELINKTPYTYNND